MIETKINIDIAEIAWNEELAEVQELSKQVFKTVIAEMSPQWLEGKKSVVINLNLSDDEEIRTLNAEFRHIDKATNVLSFANIDDEEFEAYLKRNSEIELGDIIIALPVMLVQSKEQGVSLREHYCHILVHGILHLLGYDHIDEEEAREMEGEEIRLLKILGIANPYEENK
ncbi:MAG: rRNA maturation RNase YbeY [Alphaproteobacteria bacterium]|nr:rRNA maturation RNase YbeY [Alphaproteobacteria bacterium]